MIFNVEAERFTSIEFYIDAPTREVAEEIAAKVAREHFSVHDWQLDDTTINARPITMPPTVNLVADIKDCGLWMGGLEGQWVDNLDQMVMGEIARQPPQKERLFDEETG